MTLGNGPRRRTSEAGFTLVEVVASFLIVAGAMIPLLTSLGTSTEKVMDTVNQRKMRYLMQLVLADIELGKLSEEEEERYEEGTRDDFDGWASTERPDEYEGFEYVVEILREEVIVGGEDEEALAEAGFQTDESGRIVGRPVTNDLLEEQEEEGIEPPPGQIKRVLVLKVRRAGEDADDDIEYTIMTYLPQPDEESRELGAEGGEGAAPVPGAEGQPGAGGAAGASRDTPGGSQDKR